MEQQLQLTEGATVYSSEGDKVGTMRGLSGNYIVVEKGFFFPTDYYIPVSAIATSSPEEIYLTVTKDEALNQGWDVEPMEGVMAGQSDEWNASASGTDAQVGGYQDASTMRVPVHEEHLAAEKYRVDAGEVTISKQVVEDQETIEVPVTEERVRVEWRAPSSEPGVEGAAFEEGTIEVPISREEVDVSKRTVRTGELEVTKEQEQRTKKVTDTVRREIVNVDEAGAGQDAGSGAP